MCFQSKLKNKCLRALSKHTCLVDLAVLGHLRDLQASNTEMFTFGYKYTEQKNWNFFPATWLLASVTAERRRKSGTVGAYHTCS